MKVFYSSGGAGSPTMARQGLHYPAPTAESFSYICARARIAVYGPFGSAPRIIDIAPAPVGSLIENLSTELHRLCEAQGSAVPLIVLREMAENFIHADFAEPVVSIMNSGRTLRFADHGPGFIDKQRAILPGFSTARGTATRHIRGVGSGLPAVLDFLQSTGGSLDIDYNIGGGAVVTIHLGERPSVQPPDVRPPRNGGVSPRPASPETKNPDAPLFAEQLTGPVLPRLSSRQHQVLALVMETGSAGPSVVSRELGVGVATAYRDLAALEDAGLIESDAGRRTITSAGHEFLNDLLNHN
jgi:hypothetical protein